MNKIVKKKLLLVGHEATRTGAPILLLHLLRWLSHASNHSLQVVLIRGGELVADYARIAPVVVIRNLWFADRRLVAKILRKSGCAGLTRFLQRLEFRWRLGGGFDRVLLNTLDTAEALPYLPHIHAPAIAYVHELEHIISAYLQRENVARVLSRCRTLLTCSAAVGRNLVERHGVAPERLVNVGGVIPLGEDSIPEKAASRAMLSGRLGLSASAFIVGGSGTPGWRKGSDLFVRLADCVRRIDSRREIHFVWIGGSNESITAGEFAHDVALLGLQGRVHRLDNVNNPIDHYAALDVFALTSREDPYPLVCLEAAACGVPIVCFHGAGGMPEFVAGDAGAVVPYGDCDAMAKALLEMHDDPRMREGLGRNAAAKAWARHDLEDVGPRIAAALAAAES